MAFPVLAAAAAGGAAAQFGSSVWAANQNKQSAKAQMAFQEKAYKNRYQWTVRDLKAAGLNPIYATRLNPPSLSGAGYSVPAPVLDFGGQFSDIASGQSSAQNVKTQEAQVEKMEEEKKQILQNIELTKRQTQKTISEEILIDLKGISERIQHPGMRQEAIAKKWEQLTKEQQLEVAKKLARESEIIAQLIEQGGPGSIVPLLRYIFGGMPSMKFNFGGN